MALTFSTSQLPRSCERRWRQAGKESTIPCLPINPLPSLNVECGQRPLSVFLAKHARIPPFIPTPSTHHKNNALI